MHPLRIILLLLGFVEQEDFQTLRQNFGARMAESLGVHCFAAAALSVAKTHSIRTWSGWFKSGLRNQLSFPVNKFLVPCNHPN
jgi:hypothetical protein